MPGSIVLEIGGRSTGLRLAMEVEEESRFMKAFLCLIVTAT
jgi:hypothetical protein